MTNNQPLSLFISSKMQELADERRAVQAALAEYLMHGWIWENDAGARPEPVRSAYLDEVEACDIYLGFFWLGYGPYTIEEFEHARKLQKPCLLYEKHVSIEQRSPELATFLERIQRVDNPEGLTIYRFENPNQLAAQVQSDVIRLLTTRFRESRQQSSSHLWNVPYRRNPLFTGREDILKPLHDRLATTKTAALTQPQAISGLGGVGKTQTAIEYAYRYQNEYPIVLWVRADTRDTLITDFINIADLLHLPERNEQDQQTTITAVKRWLLNHTGWLLIMDNVEDLDLVYNFMPTGSNTNGHILLTTRAHATGRIASSFRIEKMTLEEGTLLLLRRARILAPDALLDQAREADRMRAKTIAVELDGLPLALDQAGAYIEETGCDLSNYLELYRMQRFALLNERGSFASDHPESVATTFSLAFQKVQENNSSAAELLRLCTFLHPDVIPEEVFTDYKPTLDPTLPPIVADQFQLNTAIKSLLKFSLVRRNPDTKTLTIHRLVQAVLKDKMDKHMQRQWAERTVRSVSRSFPFARPETWQACQRLLPHAYTSTELIEHWNIEIIEAAGLLYRMGKYLDDLALYEEAKLCYQRALIICEKVRGLEDVDVAKILSPLAEVYSKQGKYAQAESFHKKALKIRKEALGSEHPDVAMNLKVLAGLYREQGKYAQAESLYLQALKLSKKVYGSKHHEVGVIFNDLALLYRAQGNYAKAESLYQQSLEIKIQRPEDTNLASCLSNLADLYRAQGRHREAEPLSRRALVICEKIQGTEHPDVATKMNNLALIYYEQGKYAEAESLYLRTLEINEKILGPNHPHIAANLGNLSAFYIAQGKHSQAEPFLERALAINEQVFGPGHPNVANSLNNLALCYHKQGKYVQAELTYKQALAIWEQTLGPEPPKWIVTLKNYAFLLRETKRETEALELEKRARTIGARNIRENQMYSKKDKKSEHSPKGKTYNRPSLKN
jgi:tetratricopeptide (TPR) repeat protein